MSAALRSKSIRAAIIHFFLEIKRYALFFPALGILTLVILYPMIYSLDISFYEWNLLKGPGMKFVGLANYMRIFYDPDFYIYLGHTVTLAIVSLAGTCLGGLAVALLMNEKVKGVGVFRSIFLLPWVIPPVASGVMWWWIYNTRFGILNYILISFHMPAIEWLSNSSVAIFTIANSYVWRWVGFSALVILAGLKAVPVELYEAAKVDGAGSLDRLRHITMPLIKGSIAIALVFQLMEIFKMFDLIYVLTYGGPGIDATTTLSWWAYTTSFNSWNLGLGSTISYVTAIFVIIFSYFYVRLTVRSG